MTELLRAFVADTARQLGVEEGCVHDVAVGLGKSGLLVDFMLRHAPRISAKLIDERLDACEYEGVWALYEVPPRESSVLTRTFEGDGWGRVVDSSREELERAFRNDTARALRVAAEQVAVVSLRVGSLHVGYRVTACTLSDAEIVQLLAVHDYPEVWALYKPPTRSTEARSERTVSEPRSVVVADVVTQHHVEFEGADWDYVLGSKMTELLRAFVADTARQLGVEEGCVHDVAVGLGKSGLLVDFMLRHAPRISAKLIDERLDACEYEGVWALYEVPPRESSVLTRTFEGDGWGRVVDSSREELERAFRNDTARALRVAAEQVAVVSLRVGSLHVGYRVTACTLSDAEIVQLLAVHDYPEVWALYKPPTRSTEARSERTVSEPRSVVVADVVTQHHVEFEGADWDYVLGSKMTELLRAFVADTARQLGVEEGCVHDVAVGLGKSGLLVDFMLRHAPRISAKLIDERLDACEYEGVWALYEVPPRESSVLTRTFEGDGWGRVVDSSREELERAFRNDTARALRVAAEQVAVVSLRVGSLHVGYRVTACTLSDAEIVQLLAVHDYPEVWALYKPPTRSTEARSERTVSEPRSVVVADVVTQHHVEFEGADWDYVLGSKMTELLRAFVADTARQLGVEEGCVHDVAVGLGKSGLLVDFMLRHAPRISAKLIDERLDACEYEGVWALYEVPPRESSVLTRTFEGDGWGRVVDSSREELERAFRNDTARALRVAAEQVAVVSLRVGSLHVGYRVTACTLSDAEIVQLLAVHDYPEVWALYKPPTRSTEARSERTVSEPRSVVVADVVTQHHVEFEGADWDYVLGSKMTELLRAFVADTARQLGVEEGCVHDVAVGLGKSGLLVDFMLRHAPRISAKLIDERLDACEYEGVWALYEVPPRESSVLTRTFEGDGWGRVVDSSREELERAFRNDTARALRVAAEQVAVVSLRVGSLHVGYRVTACTLSDAEIVQLLAVHDYPEVWALYKPPTRSTEARSERTVSEPRSVVVADVVTQHHVEFEGADWDYVLGSKMTELLRAFVADTARQLGVEEGCVHDVAVGLGKSGLLVDFMLRHAPRISAKLIDERLDACEYEGVWALYEVPPRESSVLTRTFEGDGWGRVVDSSREELERAFRNDTARALRVAAEQVAVVSLRVGSLHVGYRVTACTLSDAEIVQLLAVHDYPEVWALYKPPTRSTEARSERTVSEPRSVVVADVVTQHHVEFEGADWDYVLGSKMTELLRAFVADTARQLGVEEGCVHDVAVGLGKSGLLVDFMLRHAPRISAKLIDERLDACEYEGVWALYEVPPRESSVLTRTFEGDGWGRVVDSSREELERAFRNDTARALRVAAEQVAVVSLRVGSLHVGYRVTACTLSDAEIVQLLAVHDYPEVWALYKPPTRSTEARSERTVSEPRSVVVADVVTQHHVEFEGADWDYVLGSKMTELLRAFVADTARQLGVEEGCVHDVAVGLGKSGLLVDFMLRHAPRISAKLIDERLDACEYEGVWALYEVPPRESSVLTRTFEGDGWGRVVDSSREELERAFRNDTARALRVAAEQVAVVSLRVGSLHVGYRVTACTLSDAEIVQLLAVHDYPEVWALYKPPTRSTEARSERTVSEPRSVVVADVVTQHHVEFEGADWDYVLGSKMTELLRAFVADTARQLGVEEGCVHDVAVGLGKSGLLVDFMLRHAPRISAKLIDERLDACEYEGVWALYEVPPRESSVLTRTFEGDGWGRVVDSSREELERAFRNDTARALRVAAEQVAVVSLRVGSLHVGYRVTACTLSDAEIVQLLAVHDYPEVWALYKPPTRSTEARSERTVSEPRSVVVADVVTQHHVEFEGADWDYVLGSKMTELLRAFVADTARQLGVEEGCVHDVAVGLGKSGLLVDFMLRHAPRISAKLIDERLDACEYEGVWALYEVPPRESSVLTRTFEGDGWGRVVDSSREELERAFRNDTARALRVAAEQVAVVSLRVGSLHVGYRVTACTLSDAEIVQLLAVHDYPEVWALYKPPTRSTEARSERTVSEPRSVVVADVVTQHHVEFEGADWDYVLGSKMTELLRAFVADTARQLGVEEGCVHDVAVGLGKSGLLVDFMLRHAPRISAKLIDERLDACEYEGVWALYEVPPRESSVLTRTFEGTAGAAWWTAAGRSWRGRSATTLRGRCALPPSRWLW
ncbi:hypothetical protein ERJ75_000250300 [Trypanosoma vivax]|nr:hypothetical protein ERJ75_000250300 [Trypanosoma vivax]